MPMHTPPKPPGFQKGNLDPVTHDRRISAAVLATYAQAGGAYTGSITAGAPYFTGLYVSAYDMVLSTVDVDPSELPPGHYHGPYFYWDQQLAGSTDGSTPLQVTAGQYVVVSVSAMVPEHSLTPGVFTGSLALQGPLGTQPVALRCTYLAVDDNSAIGAKWAAMGGEARLGAVLSNAQADPNGPGTLQDFTNGVLYEVTGVGVFYLSNAVYAEWNSATATGDDVRTAVGVPTEDTFSTVDGGEALRFRTGAVVVRADKRAFAIYGAIYADYQQLGSLAVPNWQPVVGLPVQDEEATTLGRVQSFDGGDIYWSPATGAHEVHGAIRQHWYALGGVNWPGLPLSDETGTPDGVGRFNQFTGGVIYWTPGTGAHEVHGDILGRWTALGREKGYLGYPTSDEGDWINPANFLPGRISHFQNGSIGWTSADGPIEIPDSIPGHQNVETPAGTALGGWVDITMRSNGSYEIRYHMHCSSMIAGYDFTVRAIFAAKSGITFVGQHSGHVGGVDSDDFTEAGYSQYIWQHWADIKAGKLWVTKDYSATGVVGFVEDVAQAVLDVVAGAVGSALGVVIGLGREIGQVFGNLGVGGVFGVIAGVVVFAAGGGIVLALAAGVGVGAVTDALIKQRKLSELPAEELMQVLAVFGGSLPPLDKITLTNLAGLGGRAFTMPGVDGRYYINMGENFDDPWEHVSKFGRTPGQLLVHELTHVWQGFHGSFLPGYICSGIVNQADYVTGSSVYEYGPPGPAWSDFNLEAQGAIVDGWYRGEPTAVVPNRSPMNQADPYFVYIRDNIRNGHT